MSKPPRDPDTPETVTATVQYSNRKERFKANKIRVAASEDKNHKKCWTLMAFHDTKNAKTGRAVANGIHLYIPRAPKEGKHPLVKAISPPDLRVNSASYFKFADDIVDPENQLDTVHEFLGTGGYIDYDWNDDYTIVRGEFRFSALDSDGLPFDVKGEFKMFNPPRKP